MSPFRSILYRMHYNQLNRITHESGQQTNHSKWQPDFFVHFFISCFLVIFRFEIWKASTITSVTRLKRLFWLVMWSAVKETGKPQVSIHPSAALRQQSVFSPLRAHTKLACIWPTFSSSDWIWLPTSSKGFLSPQPPPWTTEQVSILGQWRGTLAPSCRTLLLRGQGSILRF